MAEDKEIKVVEAEFDNVIQELQSYKDAFSSARDSLIKTFDNMEKDWIGDGGTAFMLSAKVLEEEYKERIDELEGEINDLISAKISAVNIDSYLGGAIKGAIKSESKEDEWLNDPNIV